LPTRSLGSRFGQELLQLRAANWLLEHRNPAAGVEIGEALGQPQHGVVIAGGDDDAGRLAGQQDLVQHVDAILLRHDYVDQGDVGLEIEKGFGCLERIVDHADLESRLGTDSRICLRETGIVVNDQQLPHRKLPPRLPAGCGMLDRTRSRRSDNRTTAGRCKRATSVGNRRSPWRIQPTLYRYVALWLR